MNTSNALKDNRWTLLAWISVLSLVLAGCSVPSSGEVLTPTANSASSLNPAESIQFFLTADSPPVKLKHVDGSETSLKQGESVPVSVGEEISTDAGGLGKLVYSDRVNVEIIQNTVLTLTRVNEVAGGRIEVTLNLVSGHVHIRTGESGKADVILKTNDSTITTLVDDTDFTVCYVPGAKGLTCHPVIRGSIKVFGTQGTLVYDGPSGGYTFNGQSPQAAVCLHEQEYKDWLNRMRNGEPLEDLGALVAGWYGQPCPDGTSAAMPMEATPTMVMEAPPTMPAGTDMYFTEQFTDYVNPDNWYTYKWNNAGSDNFLEQNMSPRLQDGYLIFDVDKRNTSNYAIYSPNDYTDVKISVSAHNGGQNTNSVSLVCRYSHQGFYEFTIGSDGLYKIRTFMAAEKRYYDLYAGGSTAIISGMGVNEYSATCNKNELTLFINGVKATSLKENLHQLTGGKVGFGVSSYDVLPILVEIDWFKVEQP